MNPDVKAVKELLASINLSLKESEVILRSEIGKTDLETICNSFINWNKKRPCSYSHIVSIKKKGMIKIGKYLTEKKTKKQQSE